MRRVARSQALLPRRCWLQRPQGSATVVAGPQRWLSSRKTGLMGLQNSATEGEIKKKYRELALAHHPDRLPLSASDARRALARRRFSALDHEYRERLRGRPPVEDYTGDPDPRTEEDDMFTLLTICAAKLATIFVPLAGLAAFVACR